MIQGLTNMIKMAYFFKLREPNTNTKHFKRSKPPHLEHPTSLPDTQIKQLCSLIVSQQKCQNWLILIEKHKQNYILKQELYNAIRTSKINVHNLFLMLIQCRVLPQDVWIPIEWLCKLKGDHDNQLCCLIHFTVMNMGKKYQYNSLTWNKMKAELEMGANFEKVYNNSQMSLQQKIAIIPMLIVLSKKNSQVLFSRLRWLYNFPHLIIYNLHANMTKLLENRLSNTISLANPDYFILKMCIKSIQLLEVQGFISPKNLFTYSYQLYNISLLLQLLASYTPPYNEQHLSFRLLLIDFIVELFDCIEVYEYQFDYADGINNKDLTNLKRIIIKNKLYMEELNDIKFNQDIQGLINREQQKIENYDGRQKYQGIKNIPASNEPIKNGSSNATLARIIPRCSSQQWLKENNEQQDNIFSNLKIQNYSNQEQSQEYEGQYLITPLSAEQKLSRFRTQKQQTILTHILSQLYHLKTQYLQILSSILQSCYEQNDEQPWSEINSSFYKLQLYLIKNYLLQFLVYNFNALQTKNNAITMMSYYKVMGLLLRGNPIAYGKLDRILVDIQEDTTNTANIQERKQVQQHRYKSKHKQSRHNNILSNLQHFSTSFLQNIALSKPTILMILSDQFEWKENQLESYPNSTYQSIFIKKIIENKKIQWMVFVIESICCICQDQDITDLKRGSNVSAEGSKKEKQKDTFTEQQRKKEVFYQNNEKYEWVTLLLVLYYYFEETLKITTRNRRASKQETNQCSWKQKINVPNKAYLDKILEKQKFMEKLYPLKIKILIHYDNSKNTPVYKKQRLLIVLSAIMDKWQQFYNKNSKKSIIQYGLSYPMLKVFKKKLKSRIGGFVKTKQYEENGEQFYFNYSRKSGDNKKQEYA